MHEATCDECGRSCQVPFKPSGNKPVYCSRCFEQQSEGQSRRPQGRDFERRDFSDKRMYTATCDDCGDECEVPFRPTSGKPVYCSRCFKKTDSGNRKPSQKSNSDGGLGQQLQSINKKIDLILERLNSLSPSDKLKEEKKNSGKKSNQPKAAKNTETKKKVETEKPKVKKEAKKKTTVKKAKKTDKAKPAKKRVARGKKK